MKRTIAAVLLMSCVLICTGCGQDDTAPPTIDPENQTETSGTRGGVPALGNGSGSGENVWRSSEDNDEDDFDPDDHDIEGYYEDQQDEFDDYEDAEEAFEDDPDEWDDY